MGIQTRYSVAACLSKCSCVLILALLQGTSPRFRPPAQGAEAEVPTSEDITPVNEEPHTFLPQTTQAVAAAPPPNLEPIVNERPRMRTVSSFTTTSATPSTPPANNDSFASQFYPQCFSRSTPSNIPTVPQPARRQDDVPFSNIRHAFTQAIAPVATSVGGSNVAVVRLSCPSPPAASNLMTRPAAICLLPPQLLQMQTSARCWALARPRLYLVHRIPILDLALCHHFGVWPPPPRPYPKRSSHPSPPSLPV
jgi:hypothetical protein